MSATSDPEGGALLAFPCRFPIKVMGRQDADFEALVLALIGEHTPAIDPGDVRSQPSRNGLYVSITVTISAESREQLDRVYRSLTASPRVLLVL